MSKVTKEIQKNHIPLSEWDIFPWSKEMYEQHELDFQKILVEYREMRIKYNDDARMARWRWIESKGGMKMVVDIYGILQPHAVEEKYFYLSNMFERFDDWLSFQEKKAMSQEARSETIRSIFSGTKKPSLSIPQIIKEGSDRDVIYENTKIDEVTEHALNNF